MYLNPNERFALGVSSNGREQTRRRTVSALAQTIRRVVGTPGMSYRVPRTALKGKEIKSIDTQFMNGTNLWATGEASTPSIIAHGDTMHTREGRCVRVLGFLIRYRIKCGITQTTPQGTLVMIGIDKRPRGAQCAVTDVLETNADPNKLPQDAYQGRFKTLFRRVHSICGDGDANTGAYPIASVDKYVKCRPFVIEWGEADTTGVYAGAIKNMMFSIIGGSGAANDTTSPIGDGNIRVYFQDI